MEPLKIFLFGFPRFEYQGKLIKIQRRKSIAMMAYLALASQPQSRDTLAALLWADLDQERARAALRSTLHALASEFPESWLAESDRNTLILNPAVVWSDVRTFASLLAQRRTHSHDQEQTCSDCISLFQQMLALYQDEFMAGFSLNDSVEYDDWQIFQREALRRDLAGGLRRLGQHYYELADYDSGLAYGKRWLSLDPLHEPAHRLLMRLYAASGQRTEALRQYNDCVMLLDTELATPPEEETTALYRSIRASSTTSAPVTLVEGVVAGALPPMPPLVIGRENALRDIKSRLGVGGGELRSVTVIQGLPGIGKSTLVATLAHDPAIAQAFPNGVLWTSLGETPNLVAELVTWAKALRVVDTSAPQSIEEIGALLTAALRDLRMLLIVDDIWQLEHAQPFRVGGQGCALVMTSRLHDVAHALSPTAHDLYRLSLLQEDSAIELLATLAPEAVKQYPEESRQLVKDLEGLPLALQVAGRLLDTEMQLGWGVDDLLRELREGASLLEAQAPGDMVGPWRDTTPTIASLLKRSTDSLDDNTRQRFADLGLFVPKPATFDLRAMAVAWETDDPKPTARILVNRGLLEPLSGGRFQMHALLVLHARSLLGM
jgi:DNA-binding SARP family transcriptional activator